MDEEMGRIFSNIVKWFGIVLFILAVILYWAHLDILGQLALMFAMGAGILSVAINRSIEPSPKVEPVVVTPPSTRLRPAATYRSTSLYDDDDEEEDGFWSENKSVFDDDGHGPLCICLSCTFLWGTSSSQDWMDSSSSDDTFTWASDD